MHAKESVANCRYENGVVESRSAFDSGRFELILVVEARFFSAPRHNDAPSTTPATSTPTPSAFHASARLSSGSMFFAVPPSRAPFSPKCCSLSWRNGLSLEIRAESPIARTSPGCGFPSGQRTVLEGCLGATKHIRRKHGRGRKFGTAGCSAVRQGVNRKKNKYLRLVLKMHSHC